MHSGSHAALGHDRTRFYGNRDAKLVCLLLTSLFTLTTSLSTFYVSPYGNDSFSGRSAATPFKTLSHAFDATSTASSQDGVSLQLMEGVFELTSAVLDVNVSRAGPIEISSFDSRGPSSVLSGGVQVTGWTPEANFSALWSAPLPSAVSECSTMFSGTRMLVRARSPDSGQYFIWNSSLCPNVHEPPCNEEARWGFTFSGNDISPTLYDLTRVEASVYGGWTASRHRILTVMDSNRTVYFQNPSNMPIGTWPNHDSEGGGRYFLDNIREGLDAPGEWYCDLPAQECSISRSRVSILRPWHSILALLARF